MATDTARFAGFAFRGITDECTDCGCCGRSGLKRTVILEVLDADGGTGEAVNYGVDCAARALAASNPSQRITSTLVRNLAGAAESDWQARAQVARDRIAAYGPVENAPIREKAALYYGRNPHMRDRGVKASVEVAALLASARAVLAERGLTA